ncbi:MAG: AbrB/MazE/SpoVT family DNA-binding domain-containing protein [Candidatus Bathyarchaeota archaeon]|nr:AbrB/MazE/SpoVT family DNA-binding domain-containing protein [Candidatus Bathyarchaeota archaeon]
MTEQPGEEVRKIQFTGRSTYIVSLPKKWITSLGLRVGSQLVISQQKNSLILTPKEMVKPSTQPVEVVIKISSKDNPDTIIRKIISAYLSGYNFIRLQTKDKCISILQRNAIKELARKKLVGTEVVSESLNEIKLQVLVSYSELSVESALRRICLIASSMHDDAIQALKTLDEKLAQEVISLDDEVDRFSLYIIRQLKAAVQDEKILKDIGLSSPRDCLGYRVIVKFVERIADHAVKVAENVMNLKEKVCETVFQKISEMSSYAKNVFDESIKAFFKKDYALAEYVISKAKTIVAVEAKAVEEIQNKVRQTDISNVRMIMESIRRIAEYASDIAEIALNLNINQVTQPGELVS